MVQLLLHDLNHYSIKIWKDASYIFHTYLINRHVSCHLVKNSPSEILKVHINGSDPSLLQHLEESKASKRIQSIQDLNQLCSSDFLLTSFGKQKSGGYL